MAVLVGDVVRITARLLLDNIGDIINVYHFLVDTNDTANDTDFMDEAAGEMDTLYTILNSRITDRCTYITVEGFNVSQIVVLPPTSWPVLTAGTAVAEMLPEMNSACVFHRTSVPRVRASKFVPPTTEDSSSDGAIGSGYLTALQDYGDALLDGLTGTNIELAYIAYNALLDRKTRVNSRVVPQRFRTQRGRRLGVGS